MADALNSEVERTLLLLTYNLLIIHGSINSSLKSTQILLI